MSSSILAGLPIPESDDADDVPGVIGAFAAAVERGLFLYADSTADRDARYLTLPAGAIVVVLADFSVWEKTVATSATWKAIRYDSGWIVNSGYVTQTGWITQYFRARRVNDTADVRFQSRRSGADMVAAASGIHSGNLTDTPVIQLPAPFIPTGAVVNLALRTSFASAGGLIDSSGMVYLTDMYPGATLSTDDILTGNATFFLG